MSADETNIPQGLRTVAELSGESALTLWRGTTRCMGLEKVLDTPEKIERFDRAVADSVAARSSTISNLELAQLAMSNAGEALLGPDRPQRMSTADAVIQMGVNSGILRRV